MTMLQRLFSIVTLLALAACGGGGGSAGTTPFGGGGGGGGGGGPTTPSAADIVFTLSANNVSNNGTETVVATATAIDSNRNTVAGVPVTVSVNNDGVVTPGGTVTGASGQLNATIGIGSNRNTRTLTVTATSGSISKTAQLQVQDTGGGGTNATDLLLTLASATINNASNATVTATVTALDAKRNVLPGVVVSISADQGATVAPSGTTTNTTGVVTAAIGNGGNPALRTITVTATVAGLAPRTATLQVVAAPTTTNPIASDLSLALSSNTLVNGGTSTVTATVTAVDANRVALAGIPVAISVNSNAVATVSGTTTNANGVVTATIGIGADRSNRSITVTASSAGITKSATFNVIGATLSASFSPTVPAASVNNQIEYRLVDFNSTAMAGQDISVTAPGLPPGNGKTDVNGKFVYTYTAPAAAPATLIVTATAAGDTRTQSIAVQAAGTSPPNASQVPSSASLTPTPSVVSVNAVGSTANQVELRALFLGANNQPVSNVRVRFSVDPANSSDGTATQLGGTVYAYSDATGVARGTFTPGQRSSPTNGVTVRACWDTGDFDIVAACPANRLITNTLTIASEALSVNIRTNNQIKTGAGGLTYIKEYVVMVVDAAGQAKPDVLITPSVDLTAYYKGYFFWNGKKWEQAITLADTESYSWDAAGQYWKRSATARTLQPQCPNEDVNRNGVREAAAYVPGTTPPNQTPVTVGPDLTWPGRQEDLNWNGELDPRKADVAIKMIGSPRTDANGLAILQIEYGKNVASWDDFVITVTASGISGTEARARYVGTLYGIGNLPYSADDVGTESVAPPFIISPYGKGFTGSIPPFPPTGVCTDTN